MRACAACGQPVPIRWRNTGPPPQRIHLAGPVLTDRARYHPDGRPWGAVVDRTQHCDLCGTVLVHGLWAMFFEPGTAVLEHGAPDHVPVLREATDRDHAPSCTVAPTDDTVEKWAPPG